MDREKQRAEPAAEEREGEKDDMKNAMYLFMHFKALAKYIKTSTVR